MTDDDSLGFGALSLTAKAAAVEAKDYCSRVSVATQKRKKPRITLFMLKRACFHVDVGLVELLIESDMRPTVIHYARG